MKEETRTVHRGIHPVSLIGGGLAAFCSWQLNQSVGWACVHAIFGWLYLLYLCAGFGGGSPMGSGKEVANKYNASITSIVELTLDHCLEEGVDKKLVSSPYTIKRIEEDNFIAWYGYRYNWAKESGEWLAYGEADQPVPCEQPEYETIYLNLFNRSNS